MTRKFFAAILAGALLLGACGGESYNREDAINDLIEGGLEEDVAVCVVDGIEANFSIERLESTGDLTQEEEDVLFEITTDCVLGG